MPLTRPPRVYVLSLGCPKNQVDSESALGAFRELGFVAVQEPDRADVMLVNTCAFIQPAEEEAVQALLQAAAWKTRRPGRVLIAAGCLVSRHSGPSLQRLIPELDRALPAAQGETWAAAAREALQARGWVWPVKLDPESEACARPLLSGPGTAYLKIAEGCSRRCSYCIIPKLRGPLRSRPPESLVQEAAALARQGIGELVVVAQDTTVYGRDLPGQPSLPSLLGRLAKIPAVRWIRLMYAYPEGITEALIRRLTREPKLCKYLDLPLQHSQRSVLRRMGRPGAGPDFLRLLARLRRRVPGIVLRTTLLTGFPGESEAEHQALMQFVEQAQFDRLGVFAFSREAGTRAAMMSGQVSAAVKARRRRELLELQSGISRRRLAARVGQVVECLVEEPSGSRHVLARTSGDAPEVDGGIILPGRFRPGTFVTARVTGATDHDLTGVVL